MKSHGNVRADTHVVDAGVYLGEIGSWAAIFSARVEDSAEFDCDDPDIELRSHWEWAHGDAEFAVEFRERCEGSYVSEVVGDLIFLIVDRLDTHVFAHELVHDPVDESASYADGGAWAAANGVADEPESAEAVLAERARPEQRSRVSYFDGPIIVKDDVTRGTADQGVTEAPGPRPTAARRVRKPRAAGE